MARQTDERKFIEWRARVEVVHSGCVKIRFPRGAVMEIPEPREDLLRTIVATLAGGSEPC